MKKRLLVLLVTMILLFCSTPATADELTYVHLRINDVVIDCNTQSYNNGSELMVSLRTISEAFRADHIVWRGENSSVMILFDDHQMIFFLEDNLFFVDGIFEPVDMSFEISNGRVMVPVDMLAHVFDYTVHFNQEYNTIELSKDNYAVPDALKSSVQYDYEEILWLARIANVEALDIGYEAKLAVANVVLNRVKDPRFPNGIYDVIFDDGYAVQFPPAHRESFQSLEPTPDSLRAAQEALLGINNIENCLYFNHKPFTIHTLYTIIDGEYFYTD